MAQDLFSRLGSVDFGNRIILFGAAVLLSVLPIVILLSALANTQVDDDIARHLGLNHEGTRIVDGLFRTSKISFDAAVFVAILLALAGTIAVASAVQVTYEKAFDRAPSVGPSRTWSAVLCGSCAWPRCSLSTQ